MEHFDFEGAAEVFAVAGSGNWRRPMTYRRFRTAAEAIRHVIEGLSADAQRSAVIEMEDARLERAEIRALYDSPDYPLPRHGRSAPGTRAPTAGRELDGISPRPR